MISVTAEQSKQIKETYEGNILIDGIEYRIWCGELYLLFDYRKGGYQDQTEFTEQKLFSTDSVLISQDDGMPVEGLDTIYGKEAVDNGEVTVSEGEVLVSMDNLPLVIKSMYLEYFAKEAGE